MARYARLVETLSLHCSASRRRRRRSGSDAESASVASGKTTAATAHPAVTTSPTRSANSGAARSSPRKRSVICFLFFLIFLIPQSLHCICYLHRVFVFYYFLTYIFKNIQKHGHKCSSAYLDAKKHPFFRLKT